jgi:hypothetical protein
MLAEVVDEWTTWRPLLPLTFVAEGVQLLGDPSLPSTQLGSAPLRSWGSVAKHGQDHRVFDFSRIGQVPVCVRAHAPDPVGVSHSHYDSWSQGYAGMRRNPAWEARRKR